MNDAKTLLERAHVFACACKSESEFGPLTDIKCIHLRLKIEASRDDAVRAAYEDAARLIDHFSFLYRQEECEKVAGGKQAYDHLAAVIRAHAEEAGKGPFTLKDAGHGD